MNREELARNVVVQLVSSEGAVIKRYRILAVAEQVLVIDCIRKTMPVWREIEAFDNYVIDNKISESQIDQLEADQQKIAYQRYNMISPIIPFVANENMRTEAIKTIAADKGISVQTVRKYLCQYLVTMDVATLAPTAKRTRRELTPDEKNIRKALNRWYYTTKKRTLKNCYTLMLQNYYCGDDGKLLPDYPSYYQFRYFYRRYNKKSTELISRNGLSHYQRDQRPLIGDGVQEFAGTIGMGMLDATICDIYLVNDANEIVGRPELTLCVDAFSGLICGYALGWEGGIYSLRDLMLNVVSDKKSHCKKFEININAEQWPCNQLPLKLVTDKGSEYKGYNFEHITELGVELINLQSYRAELKGPVEKCFDVLQGYMAPFLKGKGFIETDFRERGAHDYRKDACLTLSQFEQIVIHCIVFYNSNRVVESFRFTEEMLIDELQPIPCKIWKWAASHIGANLRNIDKAELMKTLLPRTEARFTRKGLVVNGMYYANPLYREQYLNGKACECTYNPDDVSYVYLVENGAYVRFDLIEARYKNKTLDRVELMKSKQRELVKREMHQKMQAEIELARQIMLITNNVEQKHNPSTKNIRASRKREKALSHKNLEEAVNE